MFTVFLADVDITVTLSSRGRELSVDTPSTDKLSWGLSFITLAQSSNQLAAVWWSVVRSSV